MQQRVIVCGGRDYANKARVFDVLDKAHSANPITMLAHGGATGADSLAAKWARDRGVYSRAWPADWTYEGRAAGPKRNQRMLEAAVPHMVIAFPGGRGTADMIRRAEHAGVPVVKITDAPMRVTEFETL